MRFLGLQCEDGELQQREAILDLTQSVRCNHVDSASIALQRLQFGL